MAFKKNNPGCPCCVVECVYLSTGFNGANVPDKLVQDAGAWSTSLGKLVTSDSSAVIRSSGEVGSDYHCVEFSVTASAAGNSIDVILGWDRSSGEYLFARLTFGTDVGTVLLGEYDGASETVLNGPWSVNGLKVGLTGSEEITCSIRYNLDYGDGASGPWFHAYIQFADGTSYENQIEASEAMVAIATGQYVGIKTGTAGDYTFDDLNIQLLGYLEDGTYCGNREHCEAEHDTAMNTGEWTNTNWITPEGAVLSCDRSDCKAVLNNTFYTDSENPLIFRLDNSHPFMTVGQEVRLYFWYEDSSNHWYLLFRRNWSVAFFPPRTEVVQVSGGVSTTRFDEDYSLRCISLSHDRVRIGGIQPSGSCVTMHQVITTAPSEWSLYATAVGNAFPNEVSIGPFTWSCGELTFYPDTVTVVVTGLVGAGCITGNGSYVLDVVEYDFSDLLPWAATYTWEAYNPPSPFSLIKLTVSFSQLPDLTFDYTYTFELEWTDGGAQTATFSVVKNSGYTRHYAHWHAVPLMYHVIHFLAGTPLPSSAGSCVGGQASVS